MPEKLILVLHTTYQTMKVEKVLKANKIPHTLISKPPKVNPGCGIAIRFSMEDEEKVIKILRDENINYEGIYFEKNETAGDAP